MSRAVTVTTALLQLISSGSVAAQASRTTPSPQSIAPYVRRGDEVERRYDAYRVELEQFFDALIARVNRESPDLRPRLAPPAAVPYGYQVLPTLLAEASWTPRLLPIVLSPFSWPRTDSLISRDSLTLRSLEIRLNDSTHPSLVDRRADLEFAVGEYLALVQDQKLMAGQIQYNRLWQAEMARSPDFYRKARALQEDAVERQALRDSASRADRRSSSRLARADTLTRLIDDALRKLPTPNFVRVVHPTAHRWVLHVPVYTDIEDSGFVERFRGAIEGAWHVRAGEDEYSVTLDIRRVSPARLYMNAVAPAKGEHIDIANHIARFPADGAILTTGASTIYSIGRSILVGPHAIGPSALVHEFGHVLGFRDGYFRSSEDLGPDGYEIVEVILDPESVVAAPERGRVRREHFEQILAERNR